MGEFSMAAQSAGCVAIGIDQIMLLQPCPRIFGVICKPSPRTAQPETVTPGIHILHQAVLPHPWQGVSKQNL
jgi:hypothetical protein